jgi:hypothetical protein
MLDPQISIYINLCFDLNLRQLHEFDYGSAINYLIFNMLHPLPFRNGDGATIIGPRNKDRERQNPDLVRPPSTDHGNMANMRWSFADSHIRIEASYAFSSTFIYIVRTKYMFFLIVSAY